MRIGWGHSRRQGFSIVEIIIVVVVIGILSTVIFLTYNGVQRNAQNAQIGSAVQQWEDIFALYMHDHNGMTPVVPSGCQPLLGRAVTDFPTGSGCDSTFNPTLIADLKEANGGAEVPTGLLPNFGTTRNGIRYVYSSNDSYMQYVQYGDKCLKNDEVALYSASLKVSMCNRHLTD